MGNLKWAPTNEIMNGFKTIVTDSIIGSLIPLISVMYLFIRVMSLKEQWSEICKANSPGPMRGILQRFADFSKILGDIKKIEIEICHRGPFSDQ